MKRRILNVDSNLLLNNETKFRNDLGWSDSFSNFEQEVLEDIINPIDNYETTRFTHVPYKSSLDSNLELTDIWYYFYFKDSTGDYDNGLDYTLAGITVDENIKMLKNTTESFFRLECYKTPNNETPRHDNRKLVFSKNLSLPTGEKYFLEIINREIFVPVFIGSMRKNKENMYQYWFQDDSVLEENEIEGNVFYMTARFFNANDGNITNFLNKDVGLDEVIEENDFYYKMVISKGINQKTTDSESSMNHNNYDSENEGFVYLYVTEGTIDSPNEGVLYTRIGSTGNWITNEWNLNYPTFNYVILSYDGINNNIPIGFSNNPINFYENG